MFKNPLIFRIPILILLMLIAGIQLLIPLLNGANELNAIDILSQIAGIFFITLLIFLTYIWSQKLLGGWWAILPPFLLTFSPIIFPYYITTAFLCTLTTYYLMEFFFKPSKWHLILTGLSFGLAQLLPFPSLILIPYFLILILIFYLVSVKKDWPTTEPNTRLKRFGLRGFRYFRSIIVIFIIGYLFFLISYFLLYTSILKPIDGDYGPSWYKVNFSTELEQYHSQIAFPINTYLPFIILITSTFIYSCIGIIKSFLISGFKGFFDYLGVKFPEFSMIVFIAMYLLFMMFFSSGISAERLIPILPMVYILTASGLKRFWMNKL
ncbi:MAG: hypothetical protein HYW34_03230 [Candidatus Brennerbacteria bacterium]|nr:hypothetical protein [Candidatus Brennerbacteria bacterium]